MGRLLSSSFQIAILSNKLKSLFILSLLFFSVSLGLLWLVPEPETTIHLTVKANTTAFKVTNKSRVSMTLEKVHVDAVDPVKGLFGESFVGCVTGSLDFSVGSIVRYNSGDKGKLFLTIDDIEEHKGSPVIRLSDSGAEIPLGPGSVLKFDSSNSECSTDIPNIFPVWGPGEIGSEQLDTEASGFLYEGKAEIYGRAIEKILIFTFAPSFYHAGEIVIPAGSRILEEPDGRKWEGSDWIGTVSGAGAAKNGLQIHVKTNANALKIYQAGTGQTGFDTIQVSQFTRQFSDPTLLYIQVLVGIFVIITEIVSVFLSLTPNYSKRDREIETKQQEETIKAEPNSEQPEE